MPLNTGHYLIVLVLDKYCGSVESTQASKPEIFYFHVGSTIYYNIPAWTRVTVSQFPQLQSRKNKPPYQPF